MFSRPQLGVCTWPFGQLPLAEIVQQIAALGYDGVELLGDLSRYTAKEAKLILADHGLNLFSLTSAKVDLAHPETAVRQQAIDYYLALLDFAAELGHPLVGCTGSIGRTAPVSTMAEEMELLITAVSTIAQQAKARNLRLLIKPLNRYETHLIHTSKDALQLTQAVNQENVGILLDAFHMNIEEQDAAAAIRNVGDRLWLYHMADSNRQGIGRGHIKFGVHLWALEDIGYNGPYILACQPPLNNTFPDAADSTENVLITHLRESRSWF